MIPKKSKMRPVIGYIRSYDKASGTLVVDYPAPKKKVKTRARGR